MRNTKQEAPTERKTFVDTVWCTFILAAISASIAEFLTYPLDLIKTRLQIKGEILRALGNPYVTTGTLKTGLEIIQYEGLIKLWRGFLPAMYRHIVYSGIRVTLYDHIRIKLARYYPGDSFSGMKTAASAAASGCVGQFISSPADLIKIQMQMEGMRRKMGESPRLDGMMFTVSKVVRKSGFRGLWSGAVPNIQRAALDTIGDVGAYDFVKQTFLKRTSLEDNLYTQGLASGCAGICGTLLSTPTDVVKSRIMNAAVDVNNKGIVYKSSIDCMIKIVKYEGFFVLYSGFVPACFRQIPWALLFWTTFEHLRSFVGATTF